MGEHKLEPKFKSTTKIQHKTEKSKYAGMTYEQGKYNPGQVIKDRRGNLYKVGYKGQLTKMNDTTLPNTEIANQLTEDEIYNIKNMKTVEEQKSSEIKTIEETADVKNSIE